ncbi:MAG: Rne/Rng family ribonuclease [Burkholderiaceae bacterium]
MKRMLFNATHAEELRVAIVDGQKLIDIDIETAGRESRKSNIYKGVITRIEPSLEACFVNYGEERHGFLPFKEISKSYFKAGTEVSKARIQDALTEGQDIIVQVDKEERGSKGAALTTFISLAGRYLVLMPNNPRGGGVSRRVEGEDRQELRETMDQLEYPNGMSLIARTAGIGRSSEELQWDLNYLLQLWTAVEGAAGSSAGPFLIYQESSLVIRAIRDYFSPDIGELLIDTDDIYAQACQFMAHVMPDMESRVKRYVDDTPLYSRFQIEHQIETAYSRNVPLPSGGSIVIDHTEALVAIDVNSARATRGSDIEETAQRTNLEAADEAARQMRLRDLGGLIVIDFIDMEVSRNQREVEQRLKDALHLDRARVQAGKISRFGLMELSRQRIRPALNEGTHITCPRCTGTGVIRDIESSALQVLRVIQEESMKENTAAIYAQVPVEVATYLLNEKRAEIAKLEARTKVEIVLIPNKYLETPHHKLERLRHDDERLATYRSSYEVSDAPSTDEGYLERRAETVKPRQEAKVKGITPDSPAPKHIEKPAAAVAGTVAAGAAIAGAQKTGLFGRLFGWLSGSAANEAEAGAPAEKATRAPSTTSDSESKPARGGRGRDRNRNKRDDESPGRTRRGRSGPNAAGDAKEDKAAKPRESDGKRGRGRQKAANQSTDGESAKNETATSASGTENDGREDGRRRRRRRRPDAADTAAENADAIGETGDTGVAGVAGAAAVSESAADATSSVESAEASDAVQSEDQSSQQAATEGGTASDEAPRKRSRRRRGRRGGSRDNAVTESGTDEIEGEDQQSLAEPADSTTPESGSDSADSTDAADSTESAPRRPRRSRGGRDRKPASEKSVAQASTDTVETAPEPAPVQVEVADSKEAAPAPIVAPVAATAAEVATGEAKSAPQEASQLNGSDQSSVEPEVIAEPELPKVALSPATPEIAAPVESFDPAPMQAEKTEVAPEQVATAPTPVEVPPPAQAPAANLDEVVKDAGLQLIETASTDRAPAPAPAPAAPRPRRVRRKASVAPPAPLQQVETDGTPPAA